MHRNIYTMAAALSFVLLSASTFLLPLVLLLAGTAQAQTSTPPSAGDGSAGNPYQIATIDNLYWLTQTSSVWGDYFIQTADIDADSTKHWNFGQGFSPIGNSTTKFTGSYDGEGHTVSNLYIKGQGAENDLAFFGYTASGSVIKNLGIENADILGNDDTGVLVGIDSSTISNCYSTGSLSGASDIGGLVGSTIDNSVLIPPPPPLPKSLSKVTILNSTITNCYSSVSVSNSNSHSASGGLVGDNSDTISNCYSTGSVSGSGGGGLVGQNSGAINNCYSTGSVGVAGGTPGGLVGDNSGTISSSFWNTDSTSTGVGSGSSTGATGEPTDSMKTESTFTSRGWDFTSTWAISSGTNNGYPYLTGVDHSLPVQATDFVATASTGFVTLTWETQSEVNNAGFNVLREDPNTSSFKLIASYMTDDSLRGLGTTSTVRSYDFTDNRVASGATYDYKVQSVSTNGTTKDLSTLSVTVDVPKTYALYQNYPNPFNPTTAIGYQLSAVSHVTLKVYDVLGREVATLVDGQQNAGVYKVSFDGSRFASGVYFYRIVAEGNNGQRFISIKKLVLMK
jgi:hypothetical protein